MRVVSLILSASLLASCATGNRPEGVIPAPNAVRSIQLQLAPEQLGPAAEGGRAPEISAGISRNLRSHGYPVYDDSPSAGHHAPYTHRMEARVSSPERRSTPPGLSFTFGSSDPRALDFQKTDVVTVTCLLSDATKPSHAVTLSGDFALEVGLTNWLQARRAKPQTGFYIDRIGTVCLNLLTGLSIPKAATPESSAQAPWVPEVRVEVRDKPEDEDTTLPWVSSPAPVGASQPAAAAAPEHAVTPAPKAPVAAEENVSTETKPAPDSDRKQVVIHNRGNPVILEFGYERR